MKKIILILLILSSCKKHNDAVTQPDVTNQNAALLAGTWKYSGRVISPAYDWDGNGTLDTEVYSLYTECQKSYELKLNAAGSGTLKKICNIPFEHIEWNLLDRGLTLHYAINNGGNVSEKIILINNTTLVTESKFEPSTGETYTITNTYKNQ